MIIFLCLISLFVVAILILWAIRIDLVSSNMDEAIYFICEQDNWEYLKNIYLYPNGKFVFNSLIINIRVWTFDQMFPGLKHE